MSDCAIVGGHCCLERQTDIRMSCKSSTAAGYSTNFTVRRQSTLRKPSQPPKDPSNLVEIIGIAAQQLPSEG